MYAFNGVNPAPQGGGLRRVCVIDDFNRQTHAFHTQVAVDLVVQRRRGFVPDLKKVREQFNARWEDVIAVGDKPKRRGYVTGISLLRDGKRCERSEKIAAHVTKSVTDVIYRELNAEKE